MKTPIIRVNVFIISRKMGRNICIFKIQKKKKIRKSFIITAIALFLPSILFVPMMVYGINGASTFWSGFWQMSVIHWIAGLFDRLFIDWYWVGHTKAWIIPGTEDLRPYIPLKTLLGKWFSTIFVYPALAALTAWIVALL